jgi:hypothetical protein
LEGCLIEDVCFFASKFRRFASNILIALVDRVYEKFKIQSGLVAGVDQCAFAGTGTSGAENQQDGAGGPWPACYCGQPKVGVAARIRQGIGGGGKRASSGRGHPALPGQIPFSGL